jgi:dUTP pyrophosphatase
MSYHFSITKMPSITVKRVLENAVLPKKAHDSDVGYDLTVVNLDNVVTIDGRLPDPGVFLYDTGIAVQPENGYYVEVVPRSSLSKTGYAMANSVGIIDPDYRGTIKVALVKTDKVAKELELPFRGFQMIVRKLEQSNIVETSGELSSTTRGGGGFGSTNFFDVDMSSGSATVIVPQTIQRGKNRNRSGASTTLGDPIE